MTLSGLPKECGSPEDAERIRRNWPKAPDCRAMSPDLFDAICDIWSLSRRIEILEKELADTEHDLKHANIALKHWRWP